MKIVMSSGERLVVVAPKAEHTSASIEVATTGPYPEVPSPVVLGEPVIEDGALVEIVYKTLNRRTKDL